MHFKNVLQINIFLHQKANKSRNFNTIITIQRDKKNISRHNTNTINIKNTKYNEEEYQNSKSKEEKGGNNKTRSK